MRKLIAPAAVVILSLLAFSARADEGGYKDLNTGKVWSPPFAYISGGVGLADWVSANGAATNYSVWDYNAQNVLTFYDDWRLPTLAEMQTAVQNGTLQFLHDQYYPDARGGWRYHTSTRRGAHYAAIVLNYDANGTITGTRTVWIKPTEYVGSYDAYFIRP